MSEIIILMLLGAILWELLKAGVSTIKKPKSNYHEQ